MSCGEMGLKQMYGWVVCETADSFWLADVAVLKYVTKFTAIDL